jgi:hypothetical protein
MTIGPAAMRFTNSVFLLLSFLASVTHASDRGATSDIAGMSPDVLQLDFADVTVTDNVLELYAVPSHPGLIPPSSKHLAQRRHERMVRRQSASLALITAGAAYL